MKQTDQHQLSPNNRLNSPSGKKLIGNYELSTDGDDKQRKHWVRAPSGKSNWQCIVSLGNK